jgi:hypothetical protein
LETATTSVIESFDDKVTEFELTTERRIEAKLKGYKVHPLDQLVEGRQIKGEFVAYAKPRYERYEPYLNLGKTYPFGSKRQGFNVDEPAS